MHRFRLLLLAMAIALLACARSLPRVVHESESHFNSRLIVTEEQKGVRSLRFEPDGATQSLIRLGHPLDLQLAYTRAAMAALALVENPKRVLIVGLGGGAMPMFLRTLYPEAVIEVVDIDPGVVEVARQFFDFREDDRLHAHAGDGREFVEKSAGAYDLIFLDAYGASSIPRHLATLEFLQAVGKKLAPSGAVVGNVWESGSNPLFGAMLHTYQASFQQLCVLNVPMTSNRIFLGRGDTAVPIDAGLLARAEQLAAARKLPFSLAPYVEGGCLGVEAVDEVLRDPR